MASAIAAQVATKALGVLTAPVFDWLKTRSNRKQAKTELKAQQALVQGGQAHEVTLSAQQLELLIATNFHTTWKDEYALIVGTIFIPLYVVGCLWYAFTGDFAIIQGTTMAIQALDAVGVPMGDLITFLMFAASGINIWRRATR